MITRSHSYSSTLIKLISTLESFVIDGITTNQDMLIRMLRHQDTLYGRIYTTWVEQHREELKKITFTKKRMIPTAAATSTTIATTAPTKSAPTLQYPSHTLITSPLSGLLISLRVTIGSSIRSGDPIACISAMKMETIVTSHVTGVITQICVKQKEMISQGDVIVTIEEKDGTAMNAEKRLEAVKKQMGVSY